MLPNFVFLGASRFGSGSILAMRRKKAGERGGNRTRNLVIKSHLLCQLSYSPGRNLALPIASSIVSIHFAVTRCDWTETSTPWRLNPQLVPGTKRKRSTSRHVLDVAGIAAVHAVSSRRPRLTAG